VAAVAIHRAYRDDAAFPAGQRATLRAARRAGTLGAAAGALGAIGMVSAAGMPGLSAVGISTGLVSLGGSMLGGLIITLATPIALSAGLAYVVYRAGAPNGVCVRDTPRVASRRGRRTKVARERLVSCFVSR
jgi:hypothetical protein